MDSSPLRSEWHTQPLKRQCAASQPMCITCDRALTAYKSGDSGVQTFHSCCAPLVRSYSCSRFAKHISMCRNTAYLEALSVPKRFTNFVCGQRGHKKLCLMKRSSDNAVFDVIRSVFTVLEVQLETSCWLARVPSHSNIADKPSRGSKHELAAQGFIDQSDSIAATVNQMFAFMKLKWGKTAECCVPMDK